MTQNYFYVKAEQEEEQQRVKKDSFFFTYKLNQYMKGF